MIRWVCSNCGHGWDTHSVVCNTEAEPVIECIQCGRACRHALPSRREPEWVPRKNPEPEETGP